MYLQRFVFLTLIDLMFDFWSMISFKFVDCYRLYCLGGAVGGPLGNLWLSIFCTGIFFCFQSKCCGGERSWLLFGGRKYFF